MNVIGNRPLLRALLCAMMISTMQARAQEEHSRNESAPITLHGSMVVGGEAYDGRGDPRFSPYTGRLGISAVLAIDEEIRIPFELHATVQREGYGETFTGAGIHPELWDWLTLHAGHQSVRLSELTLSDARIVGFGVELHPGTLRASVRRGVLREAREPRSIAADYGEYRRDIIAGMIGYSGEDGSEVAFNFMKIADDSTSIIDRASAPQENALASFSFRIPLAASMRIHGEAAISAFTNDIASAAVDDASFLAPLFTPRYSTQIDGAAKLGVAIDPSSDLSFSLDGGWTGPGYRTLGDPYLVNDLLEARLSSTLSLFDEYLRIDGSLGTQIDNLRSQKLAATRRIIGSLGASVRPFDELGIEARYTNYGMRSGHVNDTLRVASIMQSLSISPCVSFDGLGGSNTLMAAYSYDETDDRTLLAESTGESRSQMATFVWSLAMPSSLSVTTTASHIWGSIGATEIMMSSIGESVAYTLFDDALTASLSLEYSIDRILTRDDHMRVSLGATYALGPFGTLAATITTGGYGSGAHAGSGRSRESYGAIRYSIGF